MGSREINIPSSKFALKEPQSEDLLERDILLLEILILKTLKSLISTIRKLPPYQYYEVKCRFEDKEKHRLRSHLGVLVKDVRPIECT